MRRLEVHYQESAAEDIESIYLYLVSQGVSVPTARGRIERIRDACRRIGDSAEGGRPREDLAPGLRTWAFERRALIGYRIERGVVVIEHVFFGGRDIDRFYARTRGGEAET